MHWTVRLILELDTSRNDLVLILPLLINIPLFMVELQVLVQVSHGGE